MSNTAACFVPVSQKTREPIKLSMQRLWLGGRILAAGARLTAQHIFRSEERKPVEVIYSFALPRDAALRSFRITGEGFEAHSELKPVEEAVRIYEDGVAAGSLSSLARQYGDGLINLTVGNVRPGETVTVFLDLLAGIELRDAGYRFRFPFTLAPAYHSKMRASAASGEGEMELLANEFGDVILPRWRKDGSGLHEVGFDLKILGAIDEIGSPSHTIRVAGGSSVSLARDHDVPNRDLVLDVRFDGSTTQVLSGAVNGKRNFAAIIPSSAFGSASPAARRIVFLLDRSGSMKGAPMEQAKKSVEACLAVLNEDDQFGLIAFDDKLEPLNPDLMSGTRENREKAKRFLSSIDARGGTELGAGIAAASRILQGAGDVLVITDGQVFGGEDILATARGDKVRLSCLGIGSASQDRFLSLLARETQGISRFVGARERVDLAAIDLFASIGHPVATGVKAGDVQPEPADVVFAGTPAVLFGEFDGPLSLEWDGGGHLSIPIPEGDAETGETVRLLRGSRLITDWESRYPKEEAVASLEVRKQSRVARRLAELSAEFGLASREMSLVAVVKRAGDRPGELPETRVVPVGMPEDTSFGAYFGGGVQPLPAAAAMAQPQPAASAWFDFYAPSIPDPADARFRSLFGKLRASAPANLTWNTADTDDQMDEPDEPELTDEDELMELAAQLEPDGGMPGKNMQQRVARTSDAVLKFVRAGHNVYAGTFRMHVARLIAFLKRSGESGLDAVIRAGETGVIPDDLRKPN